METRWKKEGLQNIMELVRMGYIGFRSNAKENGNDCNVLYRDYHKDPFLHS